MKEKREEIVKSYINAFNAFDMEGLCKDLSNDVAFKNTENGIVTVTTMGLEEFKEVTLKSQSFFEYCKQEVLEFDTDKDFVIAYVDFEAVIKEDLSEELKKGTKLKFGAKSIFNFKDDKIVSIEDYS